MTESGHGDSLFDPNLGRSSRGSPVATKGANLPNLRIGHRHISMMDGSQ